MYAVYKTQGHAEAMSDAVFAFQDMRRKISSATLVEINKTLIHNDFFIAFIDRV